MALIGTGKPGEFQIPELGKTINLTEWEEADIYDTVAIAAQVSLQGGTISFYTAPTGKNKADTNLRTSSKLPARHEVIVFKVGVYVCPIWGTALPQLSDVAAFYHEGALQVRKNTKAEVTYSHLLRFPSGYGLVAYGLDPGATHNYAPVTLGIASPAAIPPLLVPWSLQADDDFDADIVFEASGAGTAYNGVAAPGWTSSDTTDVLATKLILHGFIKSPATK